MKKIIFIIAITLILILSLITINGCSSTNIKNEEDAANKIAEIGEDIGDVGDEIEDINQDLG